MATEILGCVIVGDHEYHDDEIALLSRSQDNSWKFGGDQDESESCIVVIRDAKSRTFGGKDALKNALQFADGGPCIGSDEEG